MRSEITLSVVFVVFALAPSFARAQTRPVTFVCPSGQLAIVSKPAEEYTNAQSRGHPIIIANPTQKALKKLTFPPWEPTTLQVWQGKNRYVYTYPPQAKYIKWHYEFQAQRECTYNVAVLWAEFIHDGGGTQGWRSVQVTRRLIQINPGSPTPPQTDVLELGLIGGKLTGGWENFVTTTFPNVQFTPGYTTIIELQTVSFLPIPHVLRIQLEPPSK